MAAEMMSITPEELEGRTAYRVMTGLVVPRPIAWLSTLSKEGVPNLAPFSFYNAVSGTPPVVMISISPRRGVEKDTMRNCRDTGEFVLNLVSESLAHQMNLTSKQCPPEVNEFELAGLETAQSIDVRPPRVAAAMAAMEAKVIQIIPVPGSAAEMVLGRVVRFHFREGLLRPDYSVDSELLRPLARLGRDDYVTIGKIIPIPRPDVDAAWNSR